MVSADTSGGEGTRSYVSRLRREQAAATRQRVVTAAAELFAERGYAGTTLPAIGRRAGVSTETVQSHGPKVQLLRAAIDAVAFGAGPGAPVAETELGARLVAGVTAVEATAAAAEVLAAVNERAHGVWMAFSEASRTDPGLAEELRRLTGEITDQTRVTLQHWRPSGWLREDVAAEELVRRAVAIGSVELWDRCVRVEGHSREHYRELVAGLLLASLTTAGTGADEFDAPAGS